MEKILKKYVLLSVWSVEQLSSTAVRWSAAGILGQVLPRRRVEQEISRLVVSGVKSSSKSVLRASSRSVSTAGSCQVAVQF